MPINYGTPEEVAREHPDLVLTGTFSTPAVRMLLRRIGANLVEVPPAEDFDQIRAVTRQVASAVGAAEKGEALIAEMDAVLADLARTKPARRIVVAGWTTSGIVPAKGTLFDSIVTAAGGENVANLIGSKPLYGQYTAFDLEQVVTLRPDILAYGDSRVGRSDLSGEQLRHPDRSPALRRPADRVSRNVVQLRIAAIGDHRRARVPPRHARRHGKDG